MTAPRPRRNTEVSCGTPLSPRDVHILALAAAGRTDKVIAQRLGTTQGTIKTKMQRIFVKLNAHNRVHAAMLAVMYGYLRLPTGHELADCHSEHVVLRPEAAVAEEATGHLVLPQRLHDL